MRLKRRYNPRTLVLPSFFPIIVVGFSFFSCFFFCSFLFFLSFSLFSPFFVFFSKRWIFWGSVSKSDRFLAAQCAHGFTCKHRTSSSRRTPEPQVLVQATAAGGRPRHTLVLTSPLQRERCVRLILIGMRQTPSQPSVLFFRTTTHRTSSSLSSHTAVGLHWVVFFPALHLHVGMNDLNKFWFAALLSAFSVEHRHLLWSSFFRFFTPCKFGQFLIFTRSLRSRVCVLSIRVFFCCCRNPVLTLPLASNDERYILLRKRTVLFVEMRARAFLSSSEI